MVTPLSGLIHIFGPQGDLIEPNYDPDLKNPTLRPRDLRFWLSSQNEPKTSAPGGSSPTQARNAPKNMSRLTDDPVITFESSARGRGPLSEDREGRRLSM